MLSYIADSKSGRGMEDSLFKGIIENCNQGILAVDSSGIIIYLNSAYERLLGRNKEDICGKHVTSILENTRLHVVARTGEAELGIWQRVKGRYLYGDYIPVYKDGRLIGAAVMIYQNQEESARLISKLGTLEQRVAYYERDLKSRSERIVFDDILGKSSLIKEQINIAKRASVSNSTVLITGETGVGKEVFAQSIHNASKRSKGPFVKVNCAAIPSELLESELFGYEGGAFTGAKSTGKLGKFELANGGTIFLDEIGDMSLFMQAKILRVLQEKEIERVGGEKTIKVDVRIISATNRPIEDMVFKEKFRSDLYYRLNVIRIDIPPLRDRKEDIKVIAEKFMENYCKELMIESKIITPESMHILEEYSWPGNIRELKNIMERLVNLIDNTYLTPDDLPITLRGHKPQINHSGTLEQLLQKTEKDAIAYILKECKGNKAKAAKRLGIHRSTFYEKLEKHCIK